MVPHTAQGDGPYPRRWLAFGFLLLGSAMNLIDVTIVNVGIPSIRVDLGASAAEAEWIVAAYTLAFGLGLITGGRLGDVHGRRPVFVAGVAGFMIGSTICGVASGIGMLIAGRVVQASSAALMMPQVLSSVGVLFPPEERFKAMGMFGATIGLATVSGPLLGAVLVQADIFGAQWRPIFLVNVPIALIAAVGAWRLVPDSRGQNAPRLDWAGVGLLSVALLLLLYPLVEGRSAGWPAWAFISMGASLPALAVFVLHQRRRLGKSPLVPVSLFRQRAFAGGLIVNMVFFSGLAGYSLVLMLSLQQGLRFSPLHAAFTVLPFSLGIAIAARRTIRMLARVPGRRLVLGGTLCMAAGMTVTLIVVHLAGRDLTNWEMIPGSLIAGLGMGTVTPIISGVVLSGVDPRDAGAGAGVLSTASQIGGSIGVAIVGAIFFGALPGAASLSADPGGGYTHALGTVLFYEVPLYLACAALAALLLPRPPRPAPQPAPAPVPAAAAAVEAEQPRVAARP
jgi:EmrB/QacA subfamily drug resistance transporter